MYEPKQLEEILRGVDGKVLIKTHDYPDADAIASAYAWREILDHFEKEADIAYRGEIASGENQRVRNRLSEATKYDMLIENKQDINYSDYALVIGVDVARTESGNLTMPEGAQLNITIDHHGDGLDEDDFKDCLYNDVRKSDEIGSTATITTLYMRDFGIELDPESSVHAAIADSLTVGMAIDTGRFDTLDEFDAEAIYYLRKAIDKTKRKKLLKKDKPRNVILAQGRAMANSVKVSGVYALGYAGRLTPEFRDALVYGAEELRDEEGASCGICYGIIKDGEKEKVDIVVRTDDDNKRGAEKVAQWWGGGGRFDKAAASFDLSLFKDLINGDESKLDDLVKNAVIETVRKKTGEQQQEKKSD